MALDEVTWTSARGRTTTPTLGAGGFVARCSQMCQGRVTPEAKAGLPPLKRLVTACRRATLDPQRGRCKPVLSWHTARRPSTGRVLMQCDLFRGNPARFRNATVACHPKWPCQYNLSVCAPFDNTSFEKNNVGKTMLEDERKLRFGIWATTLSVLLQPCRTHGFMPWLEQLPTWSLVLSWLWPSRKTPWPIARARRSCSGRSCVAKCGACWQERKPTTRAKYKTTWCHPSGSIHSTGRRIKTDVPRKSDARSQSWTSAAQETCHCLSQGHIRPTARSLQACLVLAHCSTTIHGTCAMQLSRPLTPQFSPPPATSNGQASTTCQSVLRSTTHLSKRTMSLRRCWKTSEK